MTPWKYTSAANKVVFRITDDGQVESCVVAAIAAWIAEGNTPLPADPPLPPTQDEIDADAARTYPKLAALKGMTPAQASAWVETNITGIPPAAKDFLKTIAMLACVQARKI